jgi:hypothetical protein
VPGPESARRNADAPLVGFWCSLVVEIIGGVVTAVALGGAAVLLTTSQDVRTHDDLYEDNRRWFRDRDRHVGIEKARAAIELNL